jgi:hypothetical protein
MLRRLIGVVFIIAATFALLEAALRVGRGFSRDLDALLHLPPTRAAYDDVDSLEALLAETVLGFAPRTEWKGFVLNSRSFRTREYPVARQAGAYRIVTIGDSFTVGAGPWETTWSVRLERELPPLIARPVEVFALGVPGVGPAFSLRLWELEQPLLEPDLIVHAFFVGNDFTDDDSAEDADPVPTLIRVSHVARAIRNLRRARAAAELSAPGPSAADGGYAVRAADPERLTFSVEEHLAIEAERLSLTGIAHRDAFDALAARSARVLERFAAEARLAGATYVVMIIPDEYQVDPDLRARALALLGIPEHAIDATLPQRSLAALLATADIPFLDLLPDFLAAAREGPLYYPRNTHWNERGEALASRVMAAFLARHHERSKAQ